ncbi:MAG: hypothetical protein OXC68_12625 [Aestuariivita sp.]|nr:hypothetical protein [Aestuariivita sp.]
MKMLKIAALTLAGALPLLPALATAQGDDVTIIKFKKTVNHAFTEGEPLVVTVTKTGPAAVEVLWAADVPRGGTLVIHGGDSRYATPNVDFTPSRGSLVFAADDGEKTFSIPILIDGDPHEPPEQFHIGLAFQPLDDHGGHTVEIASPHAIGAIFMQGCPESLLQRNLCTR